MNPSLTITLAAASLWVIAALNAICAIPIGEEDETLSCTARGVVAIFTGVLAWQLTHITI